VADLPASSNDEDFAAHNRNFVVQLDQRGGASVVTVSGDVDALTAPQLTEAILSAASERPAAVIVDLSDVAFLASAGMSVLVEANERVGQTSKLLVVADGPATSRPIKLVGIDKIVALYPTLDAALNACGEA
jgi:anti-sigma B factor antagonist